MSGSPFLKWAGGKRQMLSTLISMMPKNYGTYYEPFVGGGALFFSIDNHNKVIGDINLSLISTYLTLRDKKDEFSEELNKIFNEFNTSLDKEKFYQDIRCKFNLNKNRMDFTIEFSAQFVFLNKACYNGLYRENSNGDFNVPFNKNTNIKTVDALKIIENSNHLKNTEIIHGDFETACKNAKKEDFIFFDSPYDDIKPNTFKMYNKSGFNIEDHKRLAKLFKEKANLGCFCMLTNHDTPLIRDLYKEFKITVIDVRRSINRNHNERVGKELIITNY